MVFIFHVALAISVSGGLWVATRILGNALAHLANVRDRLEDAPPSRTAPRTVARNSAKHRLSRTDRAGRRSSAHRRNSIARFWRTKINRGTARRLRCAACGGLKIASQVTAGQVAELVLQHLRQYPAYHHLAASSLVTAALAATGPAGVWAS